MPISFTKLEFGDSWSFVIPTACFVALFWVKLFIVLPNAFPVPNVTKSITPSVTASLAAFL